MSAGTLFTVLANIPWGQVVDNAPKVADAASKLWNSVSNRKKQSTDRIDERDEVETHAGRDEEVQARLAALESSVRELQEELQASSALIKALAEQNTQLVERVERNRTSLMRLAAASGMAVTALLIAVGVLLATTW